ncbi:dihydrofolate reductase family protein [Devosia sp. XK-2]|uniref:dihydrofolate reductase family protein n=1 Tax=Devosia sp. XK-2 TaxID=3126689 RepID=UPI0030D0AA16
MSAKIVVSQYVSLDGVIEDPVGMENSGLGDWIGEYSRGPRGDAFKEQELLKADALILGRKTYDGFAAVWPKVDSDYGRHINAMPKYLASRTVTAPDWQGTNCLGPDLAASVGQLKAARNGQIVIFGSASVCHELFKADLVDEMNLLLYPRILGRGKRLFPDGVSARFTLAETIQFNDGLLMLRYARRAD